MAIIKVMNPTGWKPPTGIDGVSFDEIHKLFASSSYGEILRQRVRYSHYKPEEVSNEEWVRILGPDVNDLEHLKTSFAVTQDFIYRARYPHPEWQSGEVNFSLEEEEVLCLTALVHDWGEAVLGDIAWHKKTADDGKAELEVLRALIEEFGRYKFVDPVVEKMHRAANVAFKKEEHLGYAFEAIEYRGYIGNAIRAWQERLNYSKPLSDLLAGLAKKIIAENLPIFQKYNAVYPASHYYSLENEKTLKEIQEANIDWRTVPILANN